jgi:hypothetical protein
MSTVGEEHLDEENVEYNHRDDSGDEKSEISGETIEVIREIFTPKETGIKVNLQQKLFPSPAEKYFTPTKHDKNKRKHTFLQGAPARIEKRGENKLMLPFQQSITTSDKMAKALGIGCDKKSNFILVQLPDEEGNYSSNKEIQEDKETQYHAISSEPPVWMLGLTISYMSTRICAAATP